MKKHNLNQEEYFYLLLIYLSSNNYDVTPLYEYFKQPDGSLTCQLVIINNLISRGFLKNLKPSAKTYLSPDCLEITTPYKESLFIDLNIAGEELWAAFPTERSYRIDGRALLTKKLVTFNSHLDLYKYYGEMIDWNPELHNLVLRALDKAKKQNKIDFTIEEWVKSKLWESFIDDEKEIYHGELV